jgi:flagellar biosynthetic protein FlhB
MAEDSDQERTLPATPRRLEQAREEGDVPRSRDLGAFLTFGAMALACAWGGPALVDACGRLVARGLAFDHRTAFTDRAMGERFAALGFDGVVVSTPLLALLAVAAAGAGLALGGWLFAPKAFQFDPMRLSPLRGLGHIFSAHGAAELGKSILKAGAVFVVAAAVVWHYRAELATLASPGLHAGLAHLGALLRAALFALAGALFLIALVDVPVVLWQYHAKLKMTPEEVRREMKETEGDPQLKARIRSQQREAARKRMMAEVPKADVVVTNPTHYAVALAYREGAMGAPRVVAKGTELVAQRIRELAAESGVALLEAPPLARALYRHADIGDEIPPALYDAVAQVLAYVYQLKRWQSHGGTAPATPRDLPIPIEVAVGDGIEERA